MKQGEFSSQKTEFRIPLSWILNAGTWILFELPIAGSFKSTP